MSHTLTLSPINLWIIALVVCHSFLEPQPSSQCMTLLAIVGSNKCSNIAPIACPWSNHSIVANVTNIGFHKLPALLVMQSNFNAMDSVSVS